MIASLLGRRPSHKPAATPKNVGTHSKLQTKGSSDPKTTATIGSLVKMRETIRDLEKRENFLNVKAKAQLEEALAKTKAGDKQGAITAMTRKKMFEKEVLNIMQMKSNLEAQMLSIESANVTLVAHEGMQAGLNAQRLVSKQLDPDAIADMHQDIEEHLNQQEEVSNILSTAYNSGDVFDEDELLAELQGELSIEAAPQKSKTSAVENEDEVERLARLMKNTSDANVVLPDAPTTPVHIVDEEVEDELRKLEREMGL